MPRISFYIQERLDGGVRTGVEVNGDTALGRFKPGRSNEPDPALQWYVDVRCSGARLPSEGEAARGWLIRNSAKVTGALKVAAAQIHAGIDPGDWPFRYEVTDRTGTRILISCSATLNLSARKLAGVLKKLGDNWEKTLENLAPLTEVS